MEGVMTAVLAHSLGDGAKIAMLEPWHADEFLETLHQARADLAPNIPAARNVHTTQDARQYLQRFADGHAKDTEHLFGIWWHGRFVGVVQLFAFSTALRTCEIGVWLAPDARGRGMVTAGCRFVIDWAIRVRGMARVQWCNDPANVRSGATARRLGMTLEGRLRSSFGMGEDRWDNDVWSIIASEWPTPV
jgi:ribosomal-protein-serine acetyltransferase